MNDKQTNWDSLFRDAEFKKYERFKEEYAQCKTNTERRALELKYWGAPKQRIAKMPPIEKDPGNKVEVHFSNREVFTKFCDLFQCAFHKGANTHHVAALEKFVHLLHDGTLKYNKSKDELGVKVGGKRYVL